MECQFVLILIGVFLHSSAVFSVTLNETGLPEQSDSDVPVPTNDHPCTNDITTAWCTCCVRGEPHYTTCDGRKFTYNTPPWRVGNMVNPAGSLWWYVWTWHAFFPGLFPRTYVRAVKLACDSTKVYFFLNPPNNRMAPGIMVNRNGVITNVQYPPSWNGQLPDHPLKVGLFNDRTPDGKGKVNIEVVTARFSHCGLNKLQNYVAAHCLPNSGAAYVSIYVRLRTLAISVNPIFCNNIQGICGDDNDNPGNDETILTNAPPWAPLLLP